MTEDATKGACGACSGFNFCFWAKFIVGIPALAIGGYAAALQFENPLMQSVAWIAAVMFMVWAALKIDKLPALQKKVFTPKNYIEYGSGTPEMFDFLEKCILLRKNIVISGGTGSGKTSLLNCLSSFIPKGERVLTIEDSAE
ncbi:MAG: Flp pilus assembly complex ATPase component TadA, partial [Rickettsiales bacterium]|nr:Flp pilus assembly complex ATPase component TadA [Rickettsiales bacterium]